MPSGPRPRARKPPIAAVGMNSLRSGRAQRRMSAAQAKTSERITSDRPMSSALPGIDQIAATANATSWMTSQMPINGIMNRM
jgi:hypothetical protein